MIKHLSILIIALSLIACSRKEGTETVSNGKRTEITPFKISRVILKDTTSVKTISAMAKLYDSTMSVSDYVYNFDTETRYLNFYQFGLVKNGIWGLIKNPESKVFTDPMGKPLTAAEKRDRIALCDSIHESVFDANGEEINMVRYACDTTSVLTGINRIDFYESWYFNSTNNMLERDLLGYSFHQYVKEKNAFRNVFYVFKDEAGFEKAKKHYFSKH